MHLNLLAIFVAALVPMLLGFIWYHPKVLGAAWMRAAGVSEDQLKTGNMLVIFGVSFFFSLLLAFEMNTLAYHDGFVRGALYYVTNGTLEADPASEAGKWWAYFQNNLSDSCRTFKHGAFHGAFLGGLFMALPMIGINGLFERKSFKYIAIHAGYWVICLALMGGVVAAWK